LPYPNASAWRSRRPHASSRAPRARGGQPRGGRSIRGSGCASLSFDENLGAGGSTLHALRPGDVRPGGTDRGCSLAWPSTRSVAAGREPERAGGRTIVLFSDGEDHAGSWGNGRRAAPCCVDLWFTPLRSAMPSTHHPVPFGPLGRDLALTRGTPSVTQRSDRVLGELAGMTGGAVVPLRSGGGRPG